MRLLLFLLLLYSCNSKFNLTQCGPVNYSVSPNYNYNSGFKKYQREIVTTLSEQDFDILFNESNISCKDVLANFFFCNICFNNGTNYLISYSEKQFDLANVSDANTFTNNVILLISSMQIGSTEYENFLKTLNTDFSKNEYEILKYHLNKSNDPKIKSIKIETH